MNKKFKIFLLILSLLLAGFLRESFFTNLNSWIDFKNGESSEVKISGIWKFIENWETAFAIRMKWIATFLFSFLFFGICFLMVETLFSEKKNRIIVLITYLGVVFLAFLSIIAGKIIPEINSITYYFSRWLMGAAQSPLLSAIICTLIFYSGKVSNKN